MKTQEEIQKAHDLLVGIILGEAPFEVTKDDEEFLNDLSTVLCWVIGDGHPPGDRFAALIQELASQATKHGATFSLKQNPKNQ